MGYIQLKLPKRIKHKIENSKRNREALAKHKEMVRVAGTGRQHLKEKIKEF